MLQFLIGGLTAWLYVRHKDQIDKAFGSKSEFRKLLKDLNKKDVAGFRDFMAKVVAGTMTATEKASEWSNTQADEFLKKVEGFRAKAKKPEPPAPPPAA